MIRIIFFIGFVMLAQQSQADVDFQSTRRMFMPRDISEPVMLQATKKRIQPTNVVAGESGDSVASKMVDNTLSLWWETTPIRNTAIGRTADKVEKNLKAEVDFGKTGHSETEHKIGIKLLAMQSLARLEYKGWVRAGINYDVRASTTQAEISETLAKNKDLIISHLITTAGSKSQVSFRWNW